MLRTSGARVDTDDFVRGSDSVRRDVHRSIQIAFAEMLPPVTSPRVKLLAPEAFSLGSWGALSSVEVGLSMLHLLLGTFVKSEATLKQLVTDSALKSNNPNVLQNFFKKLAGAAGRDRVTAKEFARSCGKEDARWFCSASDEFFLLPEYLKNNVEPQLTEPTDDNVTEKKQKKKKRTTTTPCVDNHHSAAAVELENESPIQLDSLDSKQTQKPPLDWKKVVGGATTESKPRVTTVSQSNRFAALLMQ